MKYQSKDLKRFPEQIKYALKNYHNHGINVNDYDNIVIGGLGGSGIGGHLLENYTYLSCEKPISVESDYILPKYVNEKTFVILSSYSGNTEETLSMYEDAKNKNATILIITTGGKLAKMAERDNIPMYISEKGFQPRMALGYSFSYLLLIFAEFLGVLAQRKKDLDNISEILKDSSIYMDIAKDYLNQLEPSINHKFILITDAQTESIGMRFCQQMQENVKKEAFWSVLPEANHNVIESYYSKLDSNFILINSGNNQRVSLRFSFLKDLLIKHSNKVLELKVNSLKERFEVIFVLDWISLILADRSDIVSDEIDNINSLKNFLS